MYGCIVDFYFPQLKLVVELDGSQHDPQKDSQRDARLLKNGVNVIRFANPTNQAELNSIFYRIYSEARYKLKGAWKPGKHPISTFPQASSFNQFSFNSIKRKK
jgi:very-short-patch-repair endonuclease